MDIGITIAFSHRTPVSFIADAAAYLEDAGFHSLWAPEHVLFFPDYVSSYPYSDDGKVPGDPNGLLDPFTALTFVAARTEKIRLGTGICLVPQRQPVYTAKMVADVDYLSNGRLEFGVGIGWLKEEFENLQMDFGRRAARCIEYLDAMRVLWTEEVSSFEGETIKLAPCYLNPKPVQKPYPPILFGGESDAALRRVVSHGDGWYGFDLDPESAKAKLSQLDEMLEEAGRDPGSVRRYIGPNRLRVTPEIADAYREIGLDQIVLPLFATNMDDLARRAERLKSVVGL